MTGRRGRGEAGFTLTEVSLAAVIMLIVVGMTYSIANVLVKQSVAGIGNGTAAESAQSQVATLENYLRAAVVPTAAAAIFGASGCGAGTSAVTVADDYTLEICSQRTPTPLASSYGCHSSGHGSYDSTVTTCPQLFEITVDSGSCTARGQCTLVVEDLSVAGNPVVDSFPTLRCTSACQGDLSGHWGQPGGSSPAFPYLFGYLDSSGNALDGSTPGSVQAVELDLESLSLPPSPTSSNQQWTEIRDTVWLAGAAQATT